MIQRLSLEPTYPPTYLPNINVWLNDFDRKIFFYFFRPVDFQSKMMWWTTLAKKNVSLSLIICVLFVCLSVFSSVLYACLSVSQHHSPMTLYIFFSTYIYQSPCVSVCVIQPVAFNVSVISISMCLATFTAYLGSKRLQQTK